MAPLTQANLLRMKKLIYSFFALFILSVGYGQQITGNVSDQNGQPLPGVNVTTISNSNSVSDFDGNFTINAILGEQLTFTMIGFTTKSAKASTGMKISLSEEVNMLNEVVAIGYGTKKAGSITGSVSQIKSAEILKTPAQSAIQAIQGKSAGVNIVANDEPGAQPTILIRGLGTVVGGRVPLYIIDGIEATSLNGLSSNDIATIDILKDASSLAIYGQKGASGVVLVTTKKGKKGEVKVNFDSTFGVKSILKKVDMADSYQFAYYNNYIVGSNTLYNFSQPNSTDWLDEITRTGSYSNNAVSLSGANDNSNYYFGASHYTEEGILQGAEFKRTNLNNRNEFKVLDDKLKVTQFLNFSSNRNTPKPLSAFTNAYRQSPIMPVRYSNGQYAWPLRNNGVNDIIGIKYNDAGNPVAQLDYTNEQNKFISLVGAVGAELQLIKSLKYTSNFGGTFDWGKGYTLVPNRDLWLLANPSLNAQNFTDQGNKINNTLTQRRYDSFIWNWDNYLTYNNTWNKHSLTAVAGLSRTTNNNSEELNATRYNVPQQSNYWTLNLSNNLTDINPFLTVQNKHTTERVSIAYFARVEYEFNEKYLLTASIRREGISVFQKSKQWANFPSASVGWIISKESFLNNSKFVNLLKVRAGYGEVGNGNGPIFNNLAFSNTASYSFSDGTIVPGSYLPNAVDPALTWETMKEVDFGVDFALLNNKLSGSLDYYDRKNENLLLPVKLPRAISEGNVYLNTGTVTNKGFEATLRWDDNINENLKYWIGGNFSFNKNKLESVDNEYFKNITGAGDLQNGQWTKKVVVGSPLGSFYVFETTGFDSNGQFTYNDMVDGVPGLSDDDRVFAGSYIPKYTYGANLGVSYKNIDLSVDLYGVGGNKVYNGKKATRLQDVNIEASQLENFYTPSTPNAENPAPANPDTRPSTYYVEDGSFLRINNITLGYTLPKMFNKIDKVRVFATATNPFMFTDYSGYSPEIVGDDGGNPLQRAGVELDAYPTNRTFTVGLNMIF